MHEIILQILWEAGDEWELFGHLVYQNSEILSQRFPLPLNFDLPTPSFHDSAEVLIQKSGTW